MESMENPVIAGESTEISGASADVTRKEKRKSLKKLKRKQLRREIAIREKELEEIKANDPEEQVRLRKLEEEERERNERDRREFEEREKIWLEAKKRRIEEEEEEEEEEKQRKLLEESEAESKKNEEKREEDEEFEYIEEGPAEIIWKGNEIIVKKKKIKVPKKSTQIEPIKEDIERPISNPLAPNSESFSNPLAPNSESLSSNPAQQILEKIAQETPNFGTEQDKANCPFHIKTGACRFGTRCTRLHFYPEKSCTLLIKNMYNGPGLTFGQDEGLEYTDEEIERSYEEFYEDVHTEFLKFGELINFKVCRNGSYHLRGNVYVHYKSLDSAILAYNNINGRFFGGKLITCEFVGVTKWKVAICGEYMKSRLKTCSRGNSCNFIHCFRNPGGDYEWADFDKPPPKSWIRKMVSLFGFSDQSYCASKALEYDEKRTPTIERYGSRSRRDDSDLERENYSRRRKDYSHSRDKSYERHKHEEKNKSNSKSRKRENENKSKSKTKRKEEKIEFSIDEERYNGGVSPNNFDFEKDYFEIKRNKEYSKESTRKDSKRKHIEEKEYKSGTKREKKRDKDEYLDIEERENYDYYYENYDYREYKSSRREK